MEMDGVVISQGKNRKVKVDSMEDVDVFVSLLGSNNNAMAGINGRCVAYCTCYNCKPIDEEQKQPYEIILQVLEEEYYLAGVKRELDEIYSHMSANVFPDANSTSLTDVD